MSKVISPKKQERKKQFQQNLLIFTRPPFISLKDQNQFPFVILQKMRLKVKKNKTILKF